MLGCPLGWSANDGHQAPVLTGKQAFFRENREVARRWEDFRRYSGVFRRFKKPRKAAVFSNRAGFWAEKARIGEFRNSTNLPTHPPHGLDASNLSQKTGINPGRNTKETGQEGWLRSTPEPRRTAKTAITASVASAMPASHPGYIHAAIASGASVVTFMTLTAMVTFPWLFH